MKNSLLRKGYHFLNVNLARRLNFAPYAPAIIYYEFTRMCNFQCKSCDVWKTRIYDKESFKRELNTSEVIKLARELGNIGVKFIDLYGGEPLMRKDLHQVVRAFRRYGLHVLITTNGSLLTKEKIKRLSEDGLQTIFVSIDGWDAESHDRMRGFKGAFDKAVNTIKMIKESGKMTAGINVLITKNNYRHLMKIAKLMVNLRVDGVRFLAYHWTFPFNLYSENDKSMLFTKEEIKVLMQNLFKARRYLIRHGVYANAAEYLKGFQKHYSGKPNKINCYAGFMFINIDPYGNVYPCSPMGSVGNLKEKDFKTVWHSKKFREARQRIRKLKCPMCWQSCYVEPSLRCIPIFLIKNFHHFLQEKRIYMH